MASTIENSDVNGCVGGYSVPADGSDDKNNSLGKSGGFIGEMSGTIIKNSDANLFAYVIDVRRPEAMRVLWNREMLHPY